MLHALTKKRGNLVLGITNFNGSREYELFYQAVKKVYPSEIQDTYANYFFTLNLGKHHIHFVKTIEIATDKGHVLLIGFPGKIKNRKVSDVISEAHKVHAIVIANHPLHEFKKGYFFIQKLFSIKKPINIDAKELLKNKFDAFELNAYFPKDWKKVRALAKRKNVPVVADSDAHFLDEVFTSWFEVKNLSFTSPKSFVKTLKKGIKHPLKLHARAHGYFAQYKHALQILVENFGKRLKLIKFDRL